MSDPTRREFLHQSIIAGTVLTAFGQGLASTISQEERSGKSAKKLNLLILGGTGFLGPAVVEETLARDHTITLFNRGKTNPHLFPDLEKLKGDRDPTKGDGLSALEGRSWDAVIDTSSYVPRITKASSQLLADSVEQYVLISSISVYEDFKTVGMDETAPLGTLDDETVEKVTNTTYGPLKALCEQAAEEAMPGKVTNIRPGYIVGPRDRSDRFTYWPVRVERGGEVLSPGSGDDPVQHIDVRDLAKWILHTIENRVTGVFNAAGPLVRQTMAELLYGCKAVTGGTATFTWIEKEFLAEHGIHPGAPVSFWIPGDGPSAGLTTVSNACAVEAGLTFRPLAQTVRDTLEWWHGLPAERQAKLRTGIGAEKEIEVLEAWRLRDQ